LANDGALMHPTNEYLVKRAKNRKDLTIIVQKMFFRIWDQFIESSDDATTAAFASRRRG
jgi:hypothetical protein